MGDDTPGWIEKGALNFAPDAAQAFAPALPAPDPARIGPWSAHTEDSARKDPAKAPSFWPWRIGIGAGQGLLLFALFHTRQTGQWPGGDPYLFTALALAGLFVPLLLLDGIGRAVAARLLPFAGIAAGLLAGLGWYHRWRLEGAEDSRAGLWLLGLCALGLGIAHAFLLARERSGSWRVAYANFFAESWGLAARLLLWLFALACCVTLLAVAGLPLGENAPFALMLLALASGLAFQAMAMRPAVTMMLAGMLVTMATFALPPATAAALLLISAALAQGPGELPLLFAAMAALTVAITAAHGDGLDEPRGGWRNGCAIFASFLLPVLGALALGALHQRVTLLGWTTARIFAGSAGLLFAATGIGYAIAALAALARDGDLRRLETVNRVMAVAAVALCAALASPLADPMRLAARAQVARLEGGHTSVEAFDFTNLPRDGARFGHDALAALSRSLYPDIARAAHAARGPMAVALDATEVGGNIALHTQGAQLPATLLARDWRPVMGVPACLSDPAQRCDAWFHDLNGDGQPEILLASGGDTRWWVAVMQADDAGRWSLAGRLASGCGGTLAALRTDLRAGRFSVLTALPGWNDLSVAGNRMPPAAPEQSCSHY